MKEYGKNNDVKHMTRNTGPNRWTYSFKLPNRSECYIYL